MNHNPTLHYVIGHVTLKNLVLENSEYFLKIVDEGIDDVKKFLIAVWYDIKERNPSLRNADYELFKEDFDVSIGVIDEDHKILMIVMPTVKEAPEASMIGILLDKELRYFALEYDKSVLDGKDIYMLCEWKKSGEHLNYGVVSESSFNSLLDSITKVIK